MTYSAGVLEGRFPGKVVMHVKINPVGKLVINADCQINLIHTKNQLGYIVFN